MNNTSTSKITRVNVGGVDVALSDREVRICREAGTKLEAYAAQRLAAHGVHVKPVERGARVAVPGGHVQLSARELRVCAEMGTKPEAYARVALERGHVKLAAPTPVATRASRSASRPTAIGASWALAGRNDEFAEVFAKMQKTLDAQATNVRDGQFTTDLAKNLRKLAEKLVALKGEELEGHAAVEALDKLDEALAGKDAALVDEALASFAAALGLETPEPTESPADITRKAFAARGRR